MILALRCAATNAPAPSPHAAGRQAGSEQAMALLDGIRLSDRFPCFVGQDDWTPMATTHNIGKLPRAALAAGVRQEAPLRAPQPRGCEQRSELPTQSGWGLYL